MVFSFIFAMPSVAFAAELEPEIETELMTREVHNAVAKRSVDLSDYIPDLVAFKNDVLSQFMLDDSNLTDPEGYGYLDLSKYKLPADANLYAAICEFIWYESPELFRATGFIAELGGKNESLLVGLRCDYFYDNPEDYVRDYKVSIANANKLLKGIEGNDTLNDVEKALLLHDRLATFCEYDVINLENDTLPQKVFNIYGALGEGLAVCMGYALAYDYLLERVGIESEYCSSDKMVHAWNVVYIYGEPYHVDVTWDDAANDVSGQVFHDNFLRSTDGIKETGHKYGIFNRTDFITTPKNTKYDDYFWQDSGAAFELLNDKIYYIDGGFTSESETHKKGKLIALDDINDTTPVVLKEITDEWKKVEDNTIWRYNFSKLASGEGVLYYSGKDTVYSFNPETNEETVVITPEEVRDATDDNDYAIYGFKFDGCTLSGEYSTTPNYTLTTKSENPFSKDIHTKGENWVSLVSPTETKSGKEAITCVNCDYIFEEKTVASLGKHNWGNWYYEEENKPTCTSDGIRIKICQDADCTAHIWEKVSATGHKSSDWILDGIPTETTYGLKYKECTVCNERLESRLVKVALSLKTPVVTSVNTTNGIKVTWNNIENAECYTVYRRVYNESTKKYSGWSVLKTDYTETSFTDTNVKFGIIYSYTVRAVNGDVRSSYKAATGVRVNITPTIKVANVSNGVKVSWSGVENATGYTVYSASYNAKTKKWSGWTNRGTVKSGITSWTDKKAKSGTYYKYTVRACYGSFRSSYKASDKIWFLAQPTVTVKKASNGIKVSWTQCTGEKGYTVYRAEYNPTTKKWSGWKNMGTVGKDKITWTDKSAKKGVYYKYTVRAVNGEYKSSYKASGSVKR